MEGDHTRPALLSKVKSKYGRCDYQRFDNIASTHMRAGHGTIGKVEVDCRFLFTKSLWGVIGEARNPAGIILLDLDISQPPDCKLQSAAVTVTLSEEDGVEARIKRRSPCPVKFTDYFGPKSLRGEESLVQMRKTKNRTPEVQVLGYGAGGLGVNREKVVETTGRWDFSGYITSTKDSIWYNQLRWELKESSLEVQPTHNNLFRTAFALEHNATRFYMTVHVSGKLVKFSEKVKDKLRFGDKKIKDEKVVTKIEWSGGYSCPMRLDEVAQRLDEFMRSENKGQVADEVPSALATSYHPVNASQSHAPPQFVPLAHSPSPRITLQPAPQQPILGAWFAPTLPSPHEGGLSTVTHPLQHLPALTINDLRMAAAGYAPADPSRPPPPPQSSTFSTAGTVTSEVSDDSSSTTLVNSATPREETPGDPVSDTVGKDEKDEESDEELERVPEGGKNMSLDAPWLGITAMLLEWFATMGLLLWGLKTVAPGHLKHQRHRCMLCEVDSEDGVLLGST
ncbi:hypothetical protein VTJ49DRAFT_186 [Mycothermus thermophilus]|uniref:VASt domain-containing protein n=1 Tax=Humicola insolens TaxID=85995 RepID=A0ABR3VH38_HUMIN